MNLNLWLSQSASESWNPCSESPPVYQDLQSRQVKRAPQDSINELIIRKMNPLVVPVTGVKFKAAFLHA